MPLSVAHSPTIRDNFPSERVCLCASSLAFNWTSDAACENHVFGIRRISHFCRGLTWLMVFHRKLIKNLLEKCVWCLRNNESDGFWARHTKCIWNARPLKLVPIELTKRYFWKNWNYAQIIQLSPRTHVNGKRSKHASIFSLRADSELGFRTFKHHLRNIRQKLKGQHQRMHRESLIFFGEFRTSLIPRSQSDGERCEEICR